MHHPRSGTELDRTEVRSIRARLLGFLPFLDWFSPYSLSEFQADFVSGLTVALVLIPQSMAYAQLANLPAYYGLYAAFLPPMVAALFGSSRQLATGPVAVVSLMTSTALAPLATAGSEAFIAYAIVLALLVGIFQFLLGALRLGIVVYFLSHPVVNGFTNAAALIIATSQLSKLFGVEVDGAEHHYETVYNTVVAALHHTHLPTLGLGALAFAIMIALKRINPRLPNVLFAVLVTTVISWMTGFERNERVTLEQIRAPEIRNLIAEFNADLAGTDRAMAERIDVGRHLKEVERTRGSHSLEAIDQHAEWAKLEITVEKLREKSARLRAELRAYRLVRVEDPEVGHIFLLPRDVPAGTVRQGSHWRLKIRNTPLDENALTLIGGGAVVGTIPSGLPAFSTPRLDWRVALELFPMAVIISLLGFMEAISIAKAMANRTGQRLNPNQELIGQGLGNIVGAFSQSYPVSGSFSRSAVNIQAGAMTGMSSVFSSLVVLITLLFFTPLLYHLPQAVLAAIIMMAVVGLINIRGVFHAWQAQKYDGVIAVISFVFTLAFAPHLDKGIMIGVVLSLALFLLRNMKPPTAILSRTPQGSYRSAERWGLEMCQHVAVFRFNCSLIFANVNHLENELLAVIRAHPILAHVILVGNAINELDSSGEVTLSYLVSRLRSSGIDISFSGLNDHVLDVMKRTHLHEKVGEDHFFPSVNHAVQSIHKGLCLQYGTDDCPLLKYMPKEDTPRRDQSGSAPAGSAATDPTG